MDAFTTETKKKITEDRKELDVQCRENSDSFKESLASLTSNINNIKMSLQESLKNVKSDFQDFQTSGKRLLEERIRNVYQHILLSALNIFVRAANYTTPSPDSAARRSTPPCRSPRSSSTRSRSWRRRSAT